MQRNNGGKGAPGKRIFLNLKGVKAKVKKPKPAEPKASATTPSNTTEPLVPRPQVNNREYVSNNTETGAASVKSVASKTPISVSSTAGKTTVQADDTIRKSFAPPHQGSRSKRSFMNQAKQKKLTILKKGNTFTKSVIQLVPVDNSFDDSSSSEDDDDSLVSSPLVMMDEESILMDFLDGEITRAEEKETMDRLDEEILRLEEADFMKRLLTNIEQQEAYEIESSKPTKVIEYPRITQLLMNQPLSSSSGSNDDSGMFLPTWVSPELSRFQELSLHFGRVTKALPKYLDHEHKIRAYTISEFHTGVIQSVEDSIKDFDPKLLLGFNARLRKRDPDDPYSYLLEACGPRICLELLQEWTDRWLQARINMINSQLLLSDGESIVLDIRVNPKHNHSDFQNNREDFDTAVVKSLHLDLEKINPAVGWNVNVTNLRSDPRVCRLEATVPKEVMDKLLSRSNKWIQSHSSIVESRSMNIVKYDGRTFVGEFRFKVFSPLGYSNNGIRIGEKQIPVMCKNVGVWCSHVKKNTGLANALGGPSAYDSGCVILSVNRTNVNKPTELRQLFLNARSTAMVDLTLCLSKYADLSHLPDISCVNPRRVDGRPFETESYDEIGLQRLAPTEVSSASLQQTPYIEYPSEGSPQPSPLPRGTPRTPEEKHTAMHVMLQNGRSVEIDVEFSAVESLGASSMESNTHQGLWIHNFQPDGQIMKVLGSKACTHGLVLLKANGLVIHSRDSFNEIKKLAKNASSNPTFRVTFVMYDGIDLSEVNKTKLIGGLGRVNPRRRGSGDHYPLHLYPQEGPNDTNEDSKDSGTNSSEDETPLAIRFGTKQKAKNAAPSAGKGKSGPRTSFEALREFSEDKVPHQSKTKPKKLLKKKYIGVEDNPFPIPDTSHCDNNNESPLPASDDKPIPKKKRKNDNDNKEKKYTEASYIPRKKARSGGKEKPLPGAAATPPPSASSSTAILAPTMVSEKRQNRPLCNSPYLLFANSYWDDERKTNPGASEGKIFTILEKKWESAPDHVKIIYRDKYNTEVHNSQKQALPFKLPTNTAYPLNWASSSTINQISTVSRPNKLQAFQRFKEVYKPLFSIEYNATTKLMKAQTVFGSMWRMHKELYGEDDLCGDNCKCFSRIPELTKSVIDAVAAKRRKEGDAEDAASLRKLTTGFVDHFVPRFYDLLKDEYPIETSKQIYERLVNMWYRHIKQRVYGGVKCHSDCLCEQGWDVVFGKGDPKNASAPKRVTGHHLQKKRPPGGPVAEAEEPFNKKQKASAIPAKFDIPRKKVTTPTSRLKTYEVVFDARDPMGIFFISEEGNKCKVVSIFGGRTKRDPRVQPGTIVEAVKIGSRQQQHKIKGHDDLAKYYREAKKNGAKLHVLFLNSQVTSNLTSTVLNKDWSRSGTWNDRIKGGWAGGSQRKSDLDTQNIAKKAKRATTSFIEARQVNRSRKDGTDFDTTLPGARAGANPGTEKSLEDASNAIFVSTITSFESLHRTKARNSLRGILKPSGDRQKNKRKINFVAPEAGLSSVKLYTPGTSANEWLSTSCQITVSGGRTLDLEKKAPTELIEDAAQRQSCSNLIEILEGGVSADHNVVTQVLSQQHDEVKLTLNGVKDALEKNPSLLDLKTQERDLKAKRIVLNIYLNTCHHIERAMTLQHLTNFEIRIKSLELQRNPRSETQGRTNLLTGRVKIKRTKVEELGSLPRRQVAKFVNYEGDDCKVFHAQSNLRFSLEERQLFIEFREGAKEDSMPPAKIGWIAIQMNEIDRKCPPWKTAHQDPEPLIFREDITPGDSIKRGTIKIEFRRCQISRDTIIKEKEDTVRRLNEIIEFIQRFNSEHKSDSNPLQLTANIRGRDNVSFLHAAIQLREERMVRKLIELGAKPQEKSLIGTPIHVAMKMKDRVAEKLFEQTMIGKSEKDLDAQHELLGLFGRMVDILKQGTSSAQLPDDISESLKAPTSSAVDRSSEENTGSEEEHSIQRDFELLKEIVSSAPKTAGGVDAGTHAFKSFVGSCLTLRYQKLFPTKVARRKFLNEAVSKKLLIEVEGSNRQTVKLGNIKTTAVVGRVATTITRNEAPSTSNLPHDVDRSWLIPPARKKQKFCRQFESAQFCKFDKKCHFIHIQKPPQGILSSNQLLSPVYRFNINEKDVEIFERNRWYTSGYYGRDKNVYYYAEQGKNAKKSRKGIFWYPTKKEAKEALYRVLSASHLTLGDIRELKKEELEAKNRASRSNSSMTSGGQVQVSQQMDVVLPGLEYKDWVDKGDYERCPKGDMPRACAHKATNDCKYWHVEMPFGNMMGHFDQFNTFFLDPDDVKTLKRGAFITAAYLDHGRRKIIYAEGGNSRVNYQGIHWYKTESEARHALEKVVSATRVNKG